MSSVDNGGRFLIEFRWRPWTAKGGEIAALAEWQAETFWTAVKRMSWVTANKLGMSLADFEKQTYVHAAINVESDDPTKDVDSGLVAVMEGRQ